jgi:hypothetical protein
MRNEAFEEAIFKQAERAKEEVWRLKAVVIVLLKPLAFKPRNDAAAV